MASAHGHLNNEIINNNRPPAPKFRKWLMRNNKSSLSGLMKIKWSLDINIGAVERSEAARARRLAGATVVGPVTARADQLWHAETGPPNNQIWRLTNYCVTGSHRTSLLNGAFKIYIS